jgi:hypothetical protein
MRTGAHARRTPVLLLAAVLAGGATSSASVRWGDHGHRISGRAAATNLPAEMPAFFRDAAAQLEYLNPEPDRWRNRTYAAVDDAYEFDHYVDLEIVPDSALAAVNRFQYLAILERGGMDNAARAAGLLPFRILELYERLIVEFSLWRSTLDDEARRSIEQRIINDAGILGHYVTDGANPHHATIHYNGWAEDAPNPKGFTLDRTFHRRFESDFVGAQVRLQDLLPHVSAWPRRLGDARTEIMAFLSTSNAQITRLYELEKLEGYQATTTSAAHKRFAVDRLAAGVEMLRSLWFSAWLASATPPQ